MMRLLPRSRIICVTRRADVSHLGLTANEARQRRILDRVVGDSGSAYPTAPAAVMFASHFLQARLDGIAEAYGLSHTGDLDVLTDLDRAGPPHQRTPSELAETLLLTTGGMTVRLNRLQQAGLIERLPNPRDGRGVLVRLTPIGKELAEDALATLLDTQAASLGTLQPSEQADLADLLRTLLIALGDTPAFRPAIAVQRRHS